MSDFSKSLDEIFDERAAAEKVAADKKAAEVARQDAYVSEYLVLRESVIRPTFESMVPLLDEKGILATVTSGDPEVRRSPGGHETTSNAWITIALSERGKRAASHEQPSLTVTCDRYAKQITFLKSTMVPGQGGMAGGDGSCGLDEVTPDLLNRKLLSILKDAYGAPRR